jgi:hypothetical protein
MQRAMLMVCTFLLAPATHAVGRLAEVAIVDRATGIALPVYHYRGDYWVAGAPGGKYAISIRNNLGARVLAVTSVDGINVISGDTARWDQTGYVFGPQESYQVIGWRKSQAEVADFEFDASRNSYAERTGRPANVGVIGVALFRERVPEVARQSLAPPSHAPRAGTEGAPESRAEESDRASAPSTSSPAAELAREPAAKLGTAHGARESSSVSFTDFQRASDQPEEIVRIRYDSRDNLIAMGVIRRPSPVVPIPNPFPDSPLARYVPDPPPYR